MTTVKESLFFVILGGKGQKPNAIMQVAELVSVEFTARFLFFFFFFNL